MSSAAYMASIARTSPDLSAFLNRCFEDRQNRNPGYSLRAFARDLAISPSHLSEVLKGRNGLSRAVIDTIADELKLNDFEKEYIWGLTEAQFGRTYLRRKAAKFRLKKLRKSFQPETLSNEKFRVVADWYHMAVLEMIQLKNFKIDVESISSLLGVAQTEIRDALKRLFDLEVLKEENGKLEAADFMVVGENVPSSAIRSFHTQMIDKARESVEGQSIDQRLLCSNVMAVSEKDLPRARAVIEEFLDSFIADFSVGGEKDRLYGFNLQFFDLIKKEPS